jgi:hypothetical protein
LGCIVNSWATLWDSIKKKKYKKQKKGW